MSGALKNLVKLQLMRDFVLLRETVLLDDMPPAILRPLNRMGKIKAGNGPFVCRMISEGPSGIRLRTGLYWTKRGTRCNLPLSYER